MGIFNRKRQSAPRPTAQDEAMRLYQEQKQKAMMGQSMGGFKGIPQNLPIGKKQVQEAYTVLQKYKQGTTNFCMAL